MTDPLKTGDPTKLYPELDGLPESDPLIQDIINALENNHHIGWNSMKGVGHIRPHGPVPGHLTNDQDCGKVEVSGQESTNSLKSAS